MFKDALSSYSSICLKQERIETNGDGVKPGSPPAGLGGANVQLGRVRPRMNIFTPSPFVSELYVNSCNTRSEGATGSKMKTGVRPLTWEYCSPSFPSGFPPPLGTGDNPISHRDNRAANRINRTSLAGRGRRLDAHGARVYFIIRLACEVAFRAATCKSGRKRPLCKFG